MSEPEHSDDLHDPSGGYLKLPRRLPIAFVVTFVVLAFGFGGWATAHQISDADQETRIDRMEARWERVEKFMCVVCVDRGSFDCNEICGARRLKRDEP